MKKLFTFLMALVLIVSTINAQEMRQRTVLDAAQSTILEHLTNAVISENGASSFFRASGDVILTQGFEGTTGTNLPTEWTRTNAAGTSEWNTSGTLLGGLNPFTGTRMVVNRYTENMARDAWLISPVMTLNAETTYVVKFMLVMPGFLAYNEYDYFEVKMGQTATAAGMAASTDVLYYNTNQRISTWTPMSFTFTPSETGTYHLGFHAFTPLNEGDYIAIDDISVVEAVGNELQIVANYLYKQVPVSQTITPSAQAKNTGIITQNNVVFSAELNGNSLGTVTVSSLAPDAISADLTITPAVNVPLGNNTLVYAVSSDEGAEDSTIFTFAGTINTLAIDNATASSGSGGNISPISMGNIFEITATTTLTQVMVGFNSTESVQTYTISLYEMAGDLTLTTPAVFTTPAISRTTGFSTHSVPATVLNPGRYFLCVNQTSSTNIGVLHDGNTTNSLYTTSGTNGLFRQSSFGAAAIRMLMAVDGDLEIVSIVEPVSEINLGTAETVKVLLKNNGSASISGFQMKLEVNGNEVGTETYIGTIAAFDQEEYIFTNTVDLSAAGNYTIKVTAIFASDPVQENNDKTVTVNNTVCGDLSLPVIQNFNDNSYKCWEMISNNTENGLEGTGDYTMGLVTVDGQPAFQFSSYTQVTGSATDRYYQYLITPELPSNTEDLKISFEYARANISGTGLFCVGYSSTTNAVADFTWETQVSVTGTANAFNEYSLIVPAGTKYIAINYLSTYQYILYIRNIVIGAVYDNDAAITAVSVLSAPSLVGIDLTATETVIATVKNNGTNTITDCELELVVDGMVVATESFSENISTDATANHTFIATANLSAQGEHTITVRVIFANDENPNNDSKTMTVFNQICSGVAVLPLVQDFNDYSHLCWRKISNNTANGPGSTTGYPMGLYYFDDPTDMFFAFSSYTNVSGSVDDRYHQYLISPELPEAENDLKITFDYLSYFGADETFRIGYSTTTNNVVDFIWDEEVIASNNENFLEFAGTVPAGTKYIAINYISLHKYLLFIDNIFIDEHSSLEIETLSPEDENENVAIDAIVSVVFNQNITAGDLSGITITPNVSGVSASVSNALLTIAHGDFDYETTYTVTIPVGTVEGYYEEITWSFTTVAGTTTPIEVVSTSPTDNATDVELDAEVSVIFNQDITENDLTGITINSNAATASVSGNKLIIAHSDFDNNTEYTVVVPANTITDYAAAIIWSFTTVTGATTPIEIVSTSPDNNATDVELDAEVSVTFNQDITENNLTGITINDNAATASVSGNKLIIAHSDFDNNTEYTIIVPANTITNYALEIIWSFTTKIASSIPVLNGNEINIFQNNGEINVVVSENSEIRILDMLGKVLGNYNIGANATLKVFQPSGVYLIEVRSGSAVSTHKIVVK